MGHFVLLLVLLSQQKPCEQQGQTAEPPLALGPVPAPIVQNPQNGFVPYHLIPVQRPRFPVANAALERVRCVIHNRFHP